MDRLTRDEYRSWIDPPVWGVIHLPALPGAPDFQGDAERPLRRALEDAAHLVDAGFAALVVENYGDVPFHADRVDEVTIAGMARIVAALRDRHPEVRIAVNCLRNDARAALAVAAAAGADAIRVNVHVGARLTDQGIVQGRAADTLRARRAWGAEHVRVFADVAVKHGAPLADQPLADEAADARTRGGADAILVTGRATGQAADPADVVELRDAAPDAPLLVASGCTVATAAAWAARVDGAIVGSCLMHGGRAGTGIDPERARRFLRAWSGNA